MRQLFSPHGGDCPYVSDGRYLCPSCTGTFFFSTVSVILDTNSIASLTSREGGLEKSERETQGPAHRRRPGRRGRAGRAPCSWEGPALPSPPPATNSGGRHLGGATSCQRWAAERGWQPLGGTAGSRSSGSGSQGGWGGDAARALGVTFLPTGGVTGTAFWSCSGSWCSWRSWWRDFCCPCYPDCYNVNHRCQQPTRFIPQFLL